ncbi:MAG: hypothetical protein FK730_06230, partial [Asgard group archaeon]|nr:hypothetical protein [Asgard group archaeon]
MKEARLSILKDIAEGKISAEKGQKLLEELDSEFSESKSYRFDPRDFRRVSYRNFAQMAVNLEPAVKPEFLQALREIVQEDGITHAELKE